MAENTEYLAYNIIKKLYFGNDFEHTNNEEYILDKYSTNDSNLVFSANQEDITITESEYSYIEIPDRLTNINGSHIYKLISAKDIDWDNALLNYSAVPNSNWGDFDISRRWSNTENGQQITINDVYELLNVIDYLLCSCENLWDEINKLKYNKEREKLLYFVINADEASLLSRTGSPQNYLDETQSNRNTMFASRDRKIYLNAYSNASTMGEALQHFGMVTEIYEAGAKYNIYINKEMNDYIIPGIVANLEIEYLNNPQSVININSVNTNIYGNKLFDQIRLYPSANIYNFITENIGIPAYQLIDNNNKCFKYDNVFCIDFEKDNDNSSNPIPVFKKVYIDYYFNGENYDNTSYIIYYIENDIKKIIWKSGSGLPNNPTNNIITNSEFDDISPEYSSGDFNIGKKFVIDSDDNINLLLYTFSPKYLAKFVLRTQGNISSIPTMEKSINIDYYKNENTMTNCVYTQTRGTQERQIISPITDDNEQNNILFNNTKDRYNLPANDNIDIIIETTATYLDTNNYKPNIDPNNMLDLDNCYEDIMIYKLDNNLYKNQYGEIVKDNSGNKYDLYKINETTITNNNVSNKIIKFTEDNNNIDTHIDKFSFCNKNYGILYKKINDPYKLSYSLSINSYLHQDELNFDTCKNIINNIQNKINYNPTNSTLKLSYNLGDVEQIKFDLKLSINETPKVIGVSNILPINLNKIYDPTINFIDQALGEKEIANYDKEEYDSKYYKRILWWQSGAPGEGTYDYFEDGSQKYYNKLSTIFRKEFNKKNNLPNNNQKYINIIKQLYYSNNNDYNKYYIESTSYVSEISYNMNYNIDNSNKYSYFISYYDNSYSYISLIGAEYTKNILPNNSYLTYFSYNNIHWPETIDQQSYYMFNINNLSINYRIKGGNDNWYLIEDNSSDNPRNKPYVYKYMNYNSYICSVKNNLNNLTYFLDININNFDEIGNVKQTIVTKGNDWSDKVTTHSFEIIKDQYKLFTFKEHQPLNGNITTDDSARNYCISTYVPILSMHLLQSTFKVNTIPSNTYFDFDNYYDSFVQLWDSSITEGSGDNIRYVNNSLDNYYLTNIQLQLLENTTRDLPFFNQSNIAQANFKILRHEPDPNDISELSIQNIFELDSSDKILIFDINKKYALSDLYNITKNTYNIPLGCLPYKIDNTVYFEEFTEFTSNKYSIYNTTYYMIPYIKEKEENSVIKFDEEDTTYYRNLYKFNKIQRGTNTNLFDFSLGQTDNGFESQGVFDVKYNSYININIDKLNNYQNRPIDDDKIYLPQTKRYKIEHIQSLLNINNNYGVECLYLKIAGIQSNFKFLNYKGGTSLVASNIKVGLLTRNVIESNSTRLINIYPIKTIVFDWTINNNVVNIDNSTVTNIEVFNYIDIVKNPSNNNQKYYEVKVVEGNTIITCLNDEDSVYQQLTDDRDKYNYQAKLFLSSKYSPQDGYMCDNSYYVTNGLDNISNPQNSVIQINP